MGIVLDESVKLGTPKPKRFVADLTLMNLKTGGTENSFIKTRLLNKLCCIRNTEVCLFRNGLLILFLF